ncbi:MAG TPA: ankyrin repeat domain-containing protein, partial [Thermoanaerobaculia bacterium]
EVSCRFFELYPKEAAELFKPKDYDTPDRWRPICSTTDVVTQVPATSRLLSVLDTIWGRAPRCAGTYQIGEIRARMVARIMAVVDGAPDIDARERTDADADGALKRHPDLALWGMQGLWEKRRYAELREGVAQARPALAADYARRFHLDAAHADRLAAYYVQRLIGVYVGRGSSTGSGSYSLCLTTADLDGYLATGKVRKQKCPHARFADPAPQATLRRLLGLAIVNDYPTQVVKRLIAAGARLDPPDLGAQAEESRESLLMLAAARADVIDALLAAGADPNRGNEFGKTALMYAVQELDLEGVRRLIQAGADVDAATKVGWVCEVSVQPGGRTALMYAAWQATPEIVRALLDAHADRGRADSEGKTAADYVDANQRLSEEERLATKAMLHGPQAERTRPR